MGTRPTPLKCDTQQLPLLIAHSINLFVELRIAWSSHKERHLTEFALRTAKRVRHILQRPVSIVSSPCCEVAARLLLEAWPHIHIHVPVSVSSTFSYQSRASYSTS